MIRKVLLGILVVILVLIIGAYVLFKTKGDFLLQKFGEYVEENTGAPLSMEKIPSLTFFPSPGLNVGKASWGRRDGEIYASFSRASVRVSGMAMLSGKVEITSLELDDLEVTLRPAATAKPQADGAESASSADPQGGGDRDALENPVPGALRDRLHMLLTKAPHAVSVRNGMVTIIQPDGRTVALRQADVQLKNVQPDQDISLSFKGSLDADQPELGGEMDVKAALFLGDGQDETYVRAKLDKAVFTPLRGLGFIEPVYLEGEFNYLLNSDRFDMSQVSASGLGMQVQASGEIQNVSKIARMPLFSEIFGSMRIKGQGSPRALLAALGKTMVTADPKALGQADFDLEFALRQSEIYVNKLSGTLDDITVKGDVRFDLGQPALVGSLALGDVKLQGYLPPESEDRAGQPTAADPVPADKPGASAARAASRALWPNLGMQVRMDSLETGEIRLENLDLTVSGKNGNYNVAPFSMDTLGGHIHGSLGAVFAGDTIPAKIEAGLMANLTANGIDLAQLATLLRKPGLVSGRGRLETAISFNTIVPMATLFGKGTVIAEPLHLGVSLLPDNAALPPGMPDIRNLDTVLLTFTAANGIVTVTDCTMTSPSANAAATGTVNLPAQTLNINGTVQVPGVAVFPVGLSGPLSRPVYTITARGVVDAVTQTLQQRGIDVEQKVRGELDKQVQRGLQNLLRR